MTKPHLPPSPIEEGKVTVEAIESVQPLDLFPDLLLVRIHTDAGIIGHGETYYCAEAVQAMLHDWMARRLLGEDALAIESHWRFLYERAANFGVRGTELRALSAIDVALWDILGQVCKQPVYRLLGGPVRDRIPVYNSCGNPQYGPSSTGHKGWPGMGSIGEPGPLGDTWKLVHEPAALAQELMELGYSGLKVCGLSTRRPFSMAREGFRIESSRGLWSRCERSAAKWAWTWTCSSTATRTFSCRRR